MSDISRIMTKLMSKGQGVRLIQGNVCNINPLEEWIKWLSYETEEEKEKQQLFSKLPKDELTPSQVASLEMLEEQKRLQDLFVRYNDGKCSPQEYLEVYDYTVKNDIMDLMISKLTKKELIEAYSIIENYKKLPKEDLYTIEQYYKEEENYKNLSYFDAFVLHIISDMCYEMGLENLDPSVLGQTQYRYKPKSHS